MHLDDLLTYPEAKTKAAGLAGDRTEKLLGHVRQVLGGYTHAVVSDRDLDQASRPGRRAGYRNVNGAS